MTTLSRKKIQNLHPSLCAPWSAHVDHLLQKMSIQCRNGCVEMQGSQVLITMAELQSPPEIGEEIPTNLFFFGSDQDELA